MSDLYRKASLDRLSSPEQVDKLITITSPNIWLVLVGSSFIISAALIWSVFGRIPQNVTATGIIVSGAGTRGIYADSEGIISDISITANDKVERGQVIARIGRGDVVKELQYLMARIKHIETFGMDSPSEETTQDTNNLNEIRLQYKNLNEKYTQLSDSVGRQAKQLEETKQKVSDAKNKVDQEEEAYLNTYSKDGNTNISQAKYQQAQQNYSEMYSQYNQSLSEKRAYEREVKDHEILINTYKNRQSGQVSIVIDTLQKTVTNLEAEKESLIIQRTGYMTPSSLALYDEGERAMNIEQIGKRLEAVQEQIEDSNSRIGEARKGKLDLQNVNVNADTNSLFELNMQIQMEQAQLDNARDSLQTKSSEFEESKVKYEETKGLLEEAKIEYFALLDAPSQMEQIRLQNAFQSASQEYSQIMSEYHQLQNGLESATNSLQQEQAAIHTQQASYKNQFGATKAAVLSDLELQRQKYTDQLEVSEIKALQQGIVSDVLIQLGMGVQRGSEVARIRANSDSTEKQQLVCYVPIEQGKKLRTGMSVIVYPTTVNKQEYGHMKAVISEVDTFAASATDMMSILGNEELVRKFQQEGVMVEIKATLQKDTNTASGFYWSSKKAKEITIMDATLASTTVTVEEKAPITMIIPLIKEKLAVAK